MPPLQQVVYLGLREDKPTCEVVRAQLAKPGVPSPVLYFAASDVVRGEALISAQRENCLSRRGAAPKKLFHSEEVGHRHVKHAG
jgi:hypothetical protein